MEIFNDGDEDKPRLLVWEVRDEENKACGNIGQRQEEECEKGCRVFCHAGVWMRKVVFSLLYTRRCSFLHLNHCCSKNSNNLYNRQ